MNKKCLLIVAAVACGVPFRPILSQEPEKLLYLDPSQPVERRIEDLLAHMTLKEKVGQMNMPCVYIGRLGRDPLAKQEGCRRFTLGTLSDDIGTGGGFFTLADNALQVDARQQAVYFNELQKLAIEKTRLHIPLLQSEEGTHGVMCSDKTIFPEGLAIGSTWNMDWCARSAPWRHGRRAPSAFTNSTPWWWNPTGIRGWAVTRRASARILTFARASRNPSYRERRVTVRQRQSRHRALPLPRPGQPANGLERGATGISSRTLWEVFLPSWPPGIKAGALGVMATYPAIDGVPTHASARILTHILREQLGFQGLVLSEGGGIETLVTEQWRPTRGRQAARSH